VWLASYSRQNAKGFIATGTWNEGHVERGYRMLSRALQGVGDASCERLFRMNITLCLHRAATQREVNGLNQEWQQAECGMAGGPVALIWSHGIECVESCKPCENPTMMVIDPRRPDLWIPVDCKKCPPCLARLKVRAA
jgi:hypothetical protein